MAKITVLFVPNEAGISSLTLTQSGMVTRWLRWTGYEIVDYARFLTPTRTGRMKSSWDSEISAMTPTFASVQIKNSAYYARYVFEGTIQRGYIYPTKSRALAVGRSQGGPVFIRNRVKGQVANNVPMEALHVVFARRGI